MKKILLGVAILSAMAYGTWTPTGAFNTGVTATSATTNSIVDEGNQTSGVQIITKANVVSSGIIIATTAVGTAVGANLELNHTGLTSTSLATADTIESAVQNLYIKRANNNERLGRAGYKLEVALAHDGKLKHETYSSETNKNELGEDSLAKLNHSLVLDFGTSNALNITTTAGTGFAEAKNRTLSNDDYVVSGTIKSVIAGSQTNALAGNYVNDALLTVTISKPPVTPPADGGDQG